MKGIVIRTIRESDNKVLAAIIRNTLSEFGAAKPGTVYFDPTTDDLFQVFKTEGSIYFVAELENQVVGGAGLYPTSNLPDGTCELVKLYIQPHARGKGIGKLLLESCEKAAIAIGYTKIYLETMPELTIAIPLYEKMGFSYLKTALGESGHTGCDIWMIKDLMI